MKKTLVSLLLVLVMLMSAFGGAFAEETNTRSENIGARRLYTILEKILSDISFEAPDRAGQHIVIDKAYVSEHLEDVKNDVDLQQFIL